MSAKETYSLAHTARCKLQIAADRPDRNLRFILGHAFTLDKVMLRVVEIEHESAPGPFDLADDESDWSRPTCGGGAGQRRVSFQNMTNKPMATLSSRNRSPPPVRADNVSSSEGEDDDDEEEEDDIAEDDEDTGDELSLRRFGSATERPPRLVDDDESDSDEEERNEPVSPEQMPSDLEMRKITTGPESHELAGLYNDLRRCPCHGHDQDAPCVEKVWELPRKAGDKRVAVVQFTEGAEI